MYRTYFVLLIAAICLTQCKEKAPVDPYITITKFADSLFQSHVNKEIAGAAIIISKDGNVILDKTYGFASLELEAPIAHGATFEIGSVTKQFTSLAILKLAESGKINLDDDFTEYIDFDTKGRTVTIGQLLNHTSGIASYTEIPEFWEMSLHNYERDTLVRLFEQEGFLFEPGEALIYNNSAYFLLGLILEKVSGKSYEEYLEETIFSPLEMNDTYYCSTSKVIKNKVYGYNYAADGLEQKPYLNHTWPYAAGSLCSSTNDLLKWLKAIHGDQFINQSMYDELTQPKSLKDGTAIRYATGLVNFENFGHRSIGHGGGINGFLSDSRYFPDKDLYIICLVNTTGPKGATFFADALTWNILEKIPFISVPLDIDIERLEGIYNGQIRGQKISIEIKSEGNFITQVTPQSIDTLNIYLGDNKWRNNNALIEIKDGYYKSDVISGYYILKKE